MSFNIVNVILKGEVKVPISFLPKLILMSKQVGSNEFGVFLKSEITFKDNIVLAKILPNRFVIPKQKVTPVACTPLDFKPKWCNTFLHRHPAGCKSFSGTDREHLNQEFEVSVLYIPESDQQWPERS